MTSPFQPGTLSDRQFADFAAVISTRLGIKMPASKKTMLHGRLQRRARALGLDGPAAYHHQFFANPETQGEELQHLLNLATTNKTDFFREPAHFDFLVKTALPEWRRSRRGQSFNVWSAGCSTGEEPYSIAMALAAEAEREFFDFSILASDVSTKVLQHAMDAIYPVEHAAPIPPEARHKYMLRSRDPSARKLRCAPEIRAHVRFGILNFLSPAYGIEEPLDVIFFRNVMIYFERETQQQVVGKMCRHLRSGGHLLIGHSETLNGLALPLKAVGAATYRRL